MIYGPWNIKRDERTILTAASRGMFFGVSMSGCLWGSDKGTEELFHADPVSILGKEDLWALLRRRSERWIDSLLEENRSFWGGLSRDEFDREFLAMNIPENIDKETSWTYLQTQK